MSSSLLTTHRGINRNLLILGALALLVLGGLAFFLASRKSGDTRTNIINIHNNTYFQSLIASGKSTEKDLEALTLIRPYEDGFIGISKEKLTWFQAQDLAKHTAADVLNVHEESNQSRGPLLKWLEEAYSIALSSTVWIQTQSEARVLDGSEVLISPSLERSRRVLLAWRVTGLGAAERDTNTDSSDSGRTTVMVRTWQTEATQLTMALTAIDDRERKLAALGGKFDWNSHNSLRNRYATFTALCRRIASETENKHFENCNTILEHRFYDGYILNCLSVWNSKSDPERAVTWLIERSKYPEFPFLTAACLIRAAELAGPDTQRGRELLEKVPAGGPPGMEKYRAKAKALLAGPAMATPK